MYGMSDKLLSKIKNMYVDSLAYVKVKGCKSEKFRKDSRVR